MRKLLDQCVVKHGDFQCERSLSAIFHRDGLIAAKDRSYTKCAFSWLDFLKQRVQIAELRVKHFRSDVDLQRDANVALGHHG